MAKNEIIKYFHLEWYDFDYIYQKNFSEMYEHLTKKIKEMIRFRRETYHDKYMLGVTTPGFEAALLVNKIVAKHGYEDAIKVIAVKDDFRFKFPEEYINGNVSDYEKIIGCSYHDLRKEYEIYFFNSSINLELDPAQQLRAGLIKRGF